MTAVPAVLQGAVLEPRKYRKANFHTDRYSNINLNDPKTRLIFIILLVVAIVLTLFLIGLSIYLRKEWARKKDGKKPRWGRAVLKAGAIATFLWIPIWIIKKIRSRSKGKGSYNKLGEAGGMQPQAAWYGGNAAGAYVGAGSTIHTPDPANPATAAGGLSYSYYSGQDLNAPQQPYDGVYSHGTVPTGYVAPKYDPPASLPEDSSRRSASPAPPPYHQPPSPEMHGAGAPVQTESGAWNPSK